MWARKLFTLPEPIEGAALIIPSRHPLQMWLTGALAICGVLQAIQGPPEASVVNSLVRSTNLLQMVILVCGALLCLLASWKANRKPADAMIYSGTGFFFLATVFGFYVAMYIAFLPQWWLSTSFWICLGLSLGCLHRLGQLARQYIALNRDKVLDPLKGLRT